MQITINSFYSHTSRDKEEPPHTVEDEYSIDKYGDILEIETSTSIKVGNYKTIAPIPYTILEEYLKDIISKWNQKQKHINH